MKTLLAWRQLDLYTFRNIVKCFPLNVRLYDCSSRHPGCLFCVSAQIISGVYTQSGLSNWDSAMHYSCQSRWCLRSMEGIDWLLSWNIDNLLPESRIVPLSPLLLILFVNNYCHHYSIIILTMLKLPKDTVVECLRKLTLHSDSCQKDVSRSLP